MTCTPNKGRIHEPSQLLVRSTVVAYQEHTILNRLTKVGKYRLDCRFVRLSVVTFIRVSDDGCNRQKRGMYDFVDVVTGKES